MALPQRPLSLPARLAFTVVRGAVVGAVACGGSSAPGNPADASIDRAQDAQDASADASTDGPSTCDGSGQVYCGPTEPDASCPGFVCALPCPTGCEPFV